MHADTIAPEAACTSVQFHLQVSPQDYAAHWNAAQCIAGVQLALGANSPFLFGKELWRETRIALFEPGSEIGRAHVWTPVTPIYRMPSSALKTTEASASCLI